MRTEICISIDTEFNIGGAFADPTSRRPFAEPNVYCPAQGQDNGLPFLIDTFREFGISASFFVETLNTCYFGDAPMRGITETILRHGHDVQLHLHPCWLTFRSRNWAQDLTHTPPNDRCDGRSVDELCEIIIQGTETLQRFGAPRPIAMRSGSLRADRNTYRAMSAAGLRLASNLGVAVFTPSEPELWLTGGRHWIDDVLEVPVLSFSQLRLGHRNWLRLLAITATSWREMETVLWQAHQQEVSTIVVLTHPFEFIKGDRLEPAKIRINHINQRRLRRLCAFIAEHPREFHAVTFGQAGPGWLDQGTVAMQELQVGFGTALGRMVQNKANDLISFI